MKSLAHRSSFCLHRRLAAAGITLTALHIGLQPALADEVVPTAAPTQSADSSLNEVVVTATRRTSRLLDIPASVTALTAESLQRTGAEDYRTILAAQPGVSFFDIGYQRDMTFIRGISGGTGSY